MHVLIWSHDSCEGGPDVEHVCGVFSSVAKATAAKYTFKNAMREETPYSLDDHTFSIQPADGTVAIMYTYDFHGETQVELLELVKDREEAETYIERAKESEEHDDEESEYYIVELILDSIRMIE